MTVADRLTAEQLRAQANAEPQKRPHPYVGRLVTPQGGPLGAGKVATDRQANVLLGNVLFTSAADIIDPMPGETVILD